MIRTPVLNKTTLKSPIERLYNLPVTPSFGFGIGTDDISYRVGFDLDSKHELRILNSHEKFDKLTRARGPYALRMILGVTRREMAALLAPYLHRQISKQSMIGWECREMKKVDSNDRAKYRKEVGKYAPGRKAREAYWDFMESIVCEDGWRVKVDRRYKVYWHVRLVEPRVTLRKV